MRVMLHHGRIPLGIESSDTISILTLLTFIECAFIDLINILCYYQVAGFGLARWHSEWDISTEGHVIRTSGYIFFS